MDTFDGMKLHASIGGANHGRGQPATARGQVPAAPAGLQDTDLQTPVLTGNQVRHHRQLLPATISRLFAQPPATVNVTSREEVSSALGASLYMPALRPDLASRIADLGARVGVTSVVICLEDSIPDELLDDAEENLVRQVQLVEWSELPILVFLRPRSAGQLADLIERLGPGLSGITGFVLPKFTADKGEEWLDVIEHARDINPLLFAMPILEGPEVLYVADRTRELALLGEMFERRGELIASIRIGATDLSGLLGIRRSRSSSVYDIPSIAAVIGDILNVWGRPRSRHVVTGAVWEYYRQTAGSADLGLVREIERDIECGMLGKSVIHPSHVRVVNALLTVTWSDWTDAFSILSGPGGVSASAQNDRMNESKPHANWAARVLRRSHVFGVLREGVEPLELTRVV